MDALDKLIEALGLPEEFEEWGVKFNTKNFYDGNPDDLAKLLAKSMKDRPETVFMYLFARNQELEERVEALEDWKSDFLHELEMEEYYSIHRSEEE